MCSVDAGGFISNVLQIYDAERLVLLVDNYRWLSITRSFQRVLCFVQDEGLGPVRVGRTDIAYHQL